MNDVACKGEKLEHLCVHGGTLTQTDTAGDSRSDTTAVTGVTADHGAPRVSLNMDGDNTESRLLQIVKITWSETIDILDEDYTVSTFIELKINISYKRQIYI